MFLFVLLILISMKIKRSDQLRLFSNQSLVAGSLNVIEECASLDFNNTAYQVRHLLMLSFCFTLLLILYYMHY